MSRGRKRPRRDRSHNPWREADRKARCGRTARCVRRGGGWRRDHGSRPEAQSESDGRATGPYSARASPRPYRPCRSGTRRCPRRGPGGSGSTSATPGTRSCVYDFTPRRTRDGPERFLGGYRGYLQADAFSGYDRICAGPGVIRVACWAHVRRKFYECADHGARPGPRGVGPDPAALPDRGGLPGVVGRGASGDPAAGRGAAPGGVRRAWLDEQSRQVLPKSPIGKAIAYARNQWPDLQTYIRDGELSIDNNLAERSAACPGDRPEELLIRWE